MRAEARTDWPDELARIVYYTAAAFRQPLGGVLGSRRTAPLAEARQVAMYLATRRTRHSLPRIGRFFDRHHSTVMHARDVVEMRVDENPAFAAYVAAIETALNMNEESEA